MSNDTIKRSDAIKAAEDGMCTFYDCNVLDRLNAAPSADRPSEIIYGNEHNCMMTIFGECSYSETGCGDCAVVEKVRKALSADRPQGEWIGGRVGHSPGYTCSLCNYGVAPWNNTPYCPNCGAKMDGERDGE